MLRRRPLLLLVAVSSACSFVGDILGPRDDESSDTSEAEAGSEAGSEAPTSESQESESDDSTQDESVDGDTELTQPTDVGGEDDNSGTWGETGGLEGSFETSFGDEATSFGDGDGDEVSDAFEAAVLLCTQHCERSQQCQLLGPLEFDDCENACVPTLVDLANSAGPACVQSHAALDMCAISLSCQDLASFETGQDEQLCAYEIADFEFECFF